MNRYRVVAAPPGWPEGLPFVLIADDESVEVGDEFDHDFSEEDEAANLASGLLEIVPATYRVVGGSTVDGCEPGGTFEAAMTVGREALLVAGGHIERVDEPVEDAAPDPAAPEEEQPEDIEE